MRVTACLAVLLLIATASGCGEVKPERPDPVTSKLPADPPGSEDGTTAPAFGKPKSKVQPLAVDHRDEMKSGDSLLHDSTPH